MTDCYESLGAWGDGLVQLTGVYGYWTRDSLVVFCYLQEGHD